MLKLFWRKEILTSVSRKWKTSTTLTPLSEKWLWKGDVLLSRSVSSLYFRVYFPSFLFFLPPDGCFCSRWFCRAGSVDGGGLAGAAIGIINCFAKFCIADSCASPSGTEGTCRCPRAGGWSAVPCYWYWWAMRKEPRVTQGCIEGLAGWECGWNIFYL